jgi:hypothetical protein
MQKIIGGKLMILSYMESYFKFKFISEMIGLGIGLTILAGYIYIQIIDYVDDRRRKKNK